jgi:hypothetical protein
MTEMIKRPWRIPDEALVDLGTHHYIIIPVELLDGAPSAVHDHVFRSAIDYAYFCIVEYVPAGTWMEHAEEYAPPGGIWDVAHDTTFPSIADARAFLIDEHPIAEPTWFIGCDGIRDEDMPAELQLHRRRRRR